MKKMQKKNWNALLWVKLHLEVGLKDWDDCLKGHFWEWLKSVLYVKYQNFLVFIVNLLFLLSVIF